MLIGCSAYKAREDGISNIGYEEKKLEDGSYKLVYYGSSHSSHEEVEKLWHVRAKELCSGAKYDASTEKNQWEFDTYIVLPPLIIKGKAEAPSIEGKLKCNS